MTNQKASGDPIERPVDVRAEPTVPAAIEATETYRTDEGTVFYDAENPLAWLQTDSPVRLAEQA